MASQYRDSMRYAASRQQSSSGKGGGSDALSALLGVPVSNGRQQQNRSDDYVPNRMNFEVAKMADLRRDQSVPWNKDESSEFVGMLLPLKGAGDALFKERIAPIFCCTGPSYQKSMKMARRYQRFLSLDVDDSCMDDIEEAVDLVLYRHGRRQMSVTEYLAEKSVPEPVVQQPVQDDGDSEEEWKERRRRYGDVPRDDRRDRDRWQRRGRDRDRGVEREEPPVREREEPAVFQMNSPGAEMVTESREASADTQASNDMRRTGSARRPFAGGSPRRTHSCGPAVGSPGINGVFPPSGNPRPKLRARRTASPKRMNFPPMGHGTGAR